MLTTLLVLLGFAALFVVFGTMRPADQAPGGCHGCQHEGQSAECGTDCPLLRDLDTRP